MAASQVDFLIYRGDAPRVTFVMTTNGSVSGWETELNIRLKETTPDPTVLTLDGAILDAGSPTTPGKFTVDFTEAQTLAFAAGILGAGKPYAYSFKRVNTDEGDTLTKGTMFVEYDVKNKKAA